MKDTECFIPSLSIRGFQLATQFRTSSVRFFWISVDIMNSIHTSDGKRTAKFRKLKIFDTQIVLNSLINNTWGVEERYCNVFKEGSPFTIRILALMQYYKIAVNGRHLCDYLHRLNLNSVNSIFIGGNVSIDYIQIEGDVCF
ncbi:unnamed protein product [Dracunculus medinensis]|uniref:Galectin n=1 Tax=Dracunculus medinensis TaxID=318479 RepID=A0A0N4UQV2_DRAME|nr:unnamed protein product [Dracunculus medinensis]